MFYKYRIARLKRKLKIASVELDKLKEFGVLDSPHLASIIEDEITDSFIACQKLHRLIFQMESKL